MGRRIFIFLLFMLVVPVFAIRIPSKNLDIVQGIVVDKWELGRWQTENDWTVFEGYSRLGVTIEYPLNLRGKTITLFYNKWDVPKGIIPKRKGVRCGFSVPAGTLSSGKVLWPLVKNFWLVRNQPRPARPSLPAGKPADSL